MALWHFISQYVLCLWAIHKRSYSLKVLRAAASFTWLQSVCACSQVAVWTDAVVYMHVSCMHAGLAGSACQKHLIHSATSIYGFDTCCAFGVTYIIQCTPQVDTECEHVMHLQ